MTDDIERARDIVKRLNGIEENPYWDKLPIDEWDGEDRYAHAAALAALRAAPASDAGLRDKLVALVEDAYREGMNDAAPHAGATNCGTWDSSEAKFALEQALSTPPDTEIARLKAQIAEMEGLIGAARKVAAVGDCVNESPDREVERCDAVEELQARLAKIDTEQETG